MSTPHIRSLDKALDLLEVVAADSGQTVLSHLALRLDLPPATAHRLATALKRRGYLVRVAPGRYLAGFGLTTLISEKAEAERRLLEAAGAPVIRRLAKETGLVAHLGVLENDMVTYLIKAGRDGGKIRTSAGIQLEAYCSGIGKALLAHLPEKERALYLTGGPFISLTPQTIVDPKALRQELAVTRERGYALDDREVDSNLRCLAAPLRNRRGDAVAAISISTYGVLSPVQHLSALHTAIARLENMLFPAK